MNSNTAVETSSNILVMSTTYLKLGIKSLINNPQQLTNPIFKYGIKYEWWHFKSLVKIFVNKYTALPIALWLGVYALEKYWQFKYNIIPGGNRIIDIINEMPDVDDDLDVYGNPPPLNGYRAIRPSNRQSRRNDRIPAAALVTLMLKSEFRMLEDTELNRRVIHSRACSIMRDHNMRYIDIYNVVNDIVAAYFVPTKREMQAEFAKCHWRVRLATMEYNWIRGPVNRA